MPQSVDQVAGGFFCPKCGAPLSQRRGPKGSTELYCEPGDMPLSRRVQETLERRFGPEAPTGAQTPLPPFSAQLHGGLRWYCPRDGIRLTTRLECLQCGKHLRDLVYALVELHPHRPTTQQDEGGHP